MVYLFYGCVITNFLALQLIHNYPCTQDEIYAKYTEKLIEEVVFWQEQEDPEWYAQHPSVSTPLSTTKLQGFPGIVLSCEGHYKQPTGRFCTELARRRNLQYPIRESKHKLVMGGCVHLEIPLAPALCDFFNTAEFRYTNDSVFTSP